MYLSYNILTIIGNIRIRVYVFIGLLTNIVTLVEAPKPVIKVICQGMELRMGTGHVKAKVEERKALTVYHFIFSFLFEPQECIIYLENKKSKNTL